MRQVVDTPSLLVALPQLQDPNFFRSIVLLLECSQHGALGFVVNKPSPYTVQELLVDSPYQIPEKIPSWFGGPVEAERGLVLHNQPSDPAATRFGSNVWLSSSTTAMEGLIEHGHHQKDDGRHGGESCLYPYRFIIGYSGWGSGQLTDEILEGSWLQVPYSEKVVFNTKADLMWAEAMRSIGVDPYEIVPSANPFLN